MTRLAAVAAVAALACCSAGEPAEPFAEPVVVKVRYGFSSQQIAEALVTEGIIGSKWSFLWQRILNLNQTLMAGEYQFENPVTAEEAFEMIASGKVRLYRLTVPEGLNRFQIAEVVRDFSLVSADEFLELTEDPEPVLDLFPNAKNLEGCLFPETYSLANTSGTGDLLDAMIDRFREELGKARNDRTSELNDWDALILASMIEEETYGRAERGIVSSVFHNRIQRGMLMQCDPTVIYGLILEDRYRGKIYRSDLKDPHPYNTYVHSGLPPGPITNPGSRSLQAAFSPDTTDFLYFVAKPGGDSGHTFSKTLAEHNHAVGEWRRYIRSAD